MRPHWSVFVVAVVSVLGVRGETYAQVADARPVARIAVSAHGTVTFDGVVVTIETLRPKLAELRKLNGVVWYYRESTGGAPPPQAADVIKQVIEHRLTISMSTKPDYSDVVLPDGTTKPRDVSSRP
jgi:hypothetical protein